MSNKKITNELTLIVLLEKKKRVIILNKALHKHNALISNLTYITILYIIYELHYKLNKKKKTLQILSLQMQCCSKKKNNYKILQEILIT